MSGQPLPLVRGATRAVLTKTRSTSARGQLHLVTNALPDGMSRFIALCAFLIIFALLGLLMLNIKLSEGAVAVSQQRHAVDDLVDQRQTRSERLAVVASPAQLCRLAVENGMVASGPASFIDLQNGTIVGRGSSATPEATVASCSNVPVAEARTVPDVPTRSKVSRQDAAVASSAPNNVAQEKDTTPLNSSPEKADHPKRKEQQPAKPESVTPEPTSQGTTIDRSSSQMIIDDTPEKKSTATPQTSQRSASSGSDGMVIN